MGECQEVLDVEESRGAGLTSRISVEDGHLDIGHVRRFQRADGRAIRSEVIRGRSHAHLRQQRRRVRRCIHDLCGAIRISARAIEKNAEMYLRR